MKNGTFTVVAAFILVFAALSVHAEEESVVGYSNASTYLHTGPGQVFPVLTHVPAGTNMSITGCSGNFRWCEVSWNTNHGWIEARFLDRLADQHHMNVAEFGRLIPVPTVEYRVRDDRGYPSSGATPAETRSTRYNGVDE